MGADTADEDNRGATESRERGGDGTRRGPYATPRPREEGTMCYALLTGAFEMGDPFLIPPTPFLSLALRPKGIEITPIVVKSISLEY